MHDTSGVFGLFPEATADPSPRLLQAGDFMEKEEASLFFGPRAYATVASVSASVPPLGRETAATKNYRMGRDGK